MRLGGQKVKSIIKIVGIMVMGSMALVGCMGTKNKVEEEAITDNATIQEIQTIARENIKKYFDVDINDGIVREEQITKTSLPNPDKQGEYIYSNNVFKAMAKDQVEEGQLHSYGIILSTDNKEIKGVLANIYTTQEPKKVEESILVDIAQKFLNEKGIVASGEQATFENIEKQLSTKQNSVLRFKYQDRNMLVGINLQNQKVYYFEMSNPLQQ